MFGAFSSRAFESHICCRFAHCRKDCQAGAKKGSSAFDETKPHCRTCSQACRVRVSSSLGQNRGALEVKVARSWIKTAVTSCAESVLWESFVDCCSVLSTFVRWVAVSEGTWKLYIRTKLRRKTLRPSTLLRALLQGGIGQVPVRSRRFDQFRVFSKYARRKLPRWGFKALSIQLTMLLSLYHESVR